MYVNNILNSLSQEKLNLKYTLIKQKIIVYAIY